MSETIAESTDGMRWYVVHAYSGMEKERNIVERVANAGMQDKFGQILVPTEEVVELKNGQRRTAERKFFPGYVLVQMVMDDDTWHLVKHTNKVTGLVVRATVPCPSRTTRWPKFLVKCKKAATNRGTGSNLLWVSTSASKMALSPISTVPARRSSIMKKQIACIGHHFWPFHAG